MDASSTGILRSMITNAYLGSAATLSSSGMLYGLLAGVNVVGTVNGSGVELAAVSAGIMNMIGGTLTQVKYLSALSLSSLATQVPSSGESQLLLMTNADNGATLDQLIYVDAGDRVTEFMHLVNVSGMVSADIGATAIHKTVCKSIKINLDGTTFYLLASTAPASS
jgi:hypothetical protein